jgi:4-hydroxybenzoate polyprenyltransferase
MKNVQFYLKLARWQNLLIITLTLLVVRYAFLKALGFEVYLSNAWHVVFVLSTVLIAAGGNIVNDAFDVVADRINKPEKQIVGVKISPESARILGQVVLLLGVISGLTLGYSTDTLTFSYIFPISAVLLWTYSTVLKRQPFLGNALVSLLGAVMVGNTILFDLIKTLNAENIAMQRTAMAVIGILAGFAFVTTLCRELIKDMQDIPGDAKAGYKTLPITSGTLFPKILVIVLVMLITVSIGWLVRVTFLGSDYLSAAYLIIALIIPLLVIMVRTAPANNRKQLGHISNLFKWVMVAGIMSLVVFTTAYKMNLPEQERPYDIQIDAVH